MAPDPQLPSEYRPGGARVLALGWWLLAALLTADLLWRGDAGAVLVGVSLLGLSCAVVHALFWQPAVRVDDDGVELVNVLRRVRLPWASVQELDTRWALSLVADGRRWTSWAAPASGRRVRPVSRRETPWAERGAEAIAGSRAPGSSAGEAAVLVGTRLQAWREAHPGATTGGGGPPQVGWNTAVLVSLGATSALVVAAFVLA